MTTLKNKTIFITGGSRGIGEAIALRAARDGANIVIAAKTATPHQQLPGTIFSVADAIVKAGGQALPIATDIRDPEQIQNAIEQTISKFSGIDILINNAGAINLTPTLKTSVKRFDLMFDVNVRATFLCSQACIPYLKQAQNPHILNLSPPPSLDPKWFKNHVAYTLSKYGMSLCVLGLSEEFRKDGIAVNSLWPRTAIDTAALAMISGLVKRESCRKPAIVADAAHYILTRDSRQCTGNFFIDEAVLKDAGITDMDAYAVTPGEKLQTDLFLD